MATLSLATILAESARRYPEQTALIEGDRTVTYRELWYQARQHAAALQEAGVLPGDAVALAAPNTMEFVRAYYGILAAGAVVVPVQLLLQPEEAGYLLQDSGAVVVLAHPAVRELAAGAAEHAELPVFLLPSDTAAAADHDPGAEPPVLRTGCEPQPRMASRSPEDPAVIFYTSGTTGRPKGAVLTQLNLVMNAMVNAFDGVPTSAEDVVLGCLPLFHVFGQTVSLNATFRVGGTLVLQPAFQPQQAIELMREHSVTLLNAVPTMYVRMLEVAEPMDEVAQRSLPSPRYCVSGGAALPVAVLHRFGELFGTEVLEGYGLSETSPTATVNQPIFGARAGTVGHSMWGTEVAVADPERDTEISLLPDGEHGEVVVRGHHVFDGYLNNPEATEQALVDGWFRTGDIGVIDGEGYLAIVDRKKDLIIRNGYNVYPREVEEVLNHHPGLSQVAVIGLADAEHGEEIAAVVVPAAEQIPSESELIDWASERLAHHKHPRRVYFVDELPLGPSQKVLKRELRKRFSAATDTTSS